MPTKSVPVGALRFGMYIAALDRPWTDTPFMFQGFYLRTDRQFEALQRLCKYVFVDPAQSELSGAPPASAPATASTPGFVIVGTADYPEQTGLGEELRRASAIYARSVIALRDFCRPLESGSAADGKDICGTLKQLADSVVRNPDALLLLSKLRGTGVSAHARALQVSVYMMVFARFLQLEREEIELLGLVGLVQDIGKTRLPAALLEKPEALTAAESEVMKKHVELSGHILSATSNLPPRVAELALLHHERQDGTGYPRGLKAYQIGLYGSIAAICDTYDALMAVRPYARECSPSDAAKVLLAGRGSAFHAELVDEFMRSLGAFPVGTVVELDSGEIGVVVAENRAERLKPKVMIILDEAGRRAPANSVLDLSAERQSGGGGRYRVRRTLEHSKLDFDPRRLFL